MKAKLNCYTKDVVEKKTVLPVEAFIIILRSANMRDISLVEMH